MRGVWGCRLAGLALPAWLCATTALSVLPAQAQTPPPADVAKPGTPGQLESIVVTAERRSTNIQKTPLAITAITSKTLDTSNAAVLSDLNGTIPSMEVTKTGGLENVVTIRGIGLQTPENTSTTVPGVALFVDGVYISNTISLDQSFFDIDHIEVLRGPQGAIYGQAAAGGAVNILTKQPELGVYGGTADVSVGNYDLFRERTEVNIPVGDSIAVRASIQKYDHNGFAENTGIPNDDQDAQHDISGKVAVLWKPVANFSATLTGQWYNAAEHGQEQKSTLDPNPDPRVDTQDFQSQLYLNAQLYHLNLKWDLDWFSIKSVSAYQYENTNTPYSSSRGAYSYLGAYDDVAGYDTTQHNYNEEFDILSSPESRLQWIVGGFALLQRSTQFVAEFEGSAPNPDLTIAPDIATEPPANLAYGNLTTVVRHSYSVFGQATYSIFDNLHVTAGGRYNYDDYNLNSDNFSAFAIDSVAHRYVDHKPTFRTELDYDATPDNMIYASISQGYKPGGVNGIASAYVVPNAYKPETNTSFEIGSKNYFLDRTLRINAAAFYYMYRDQQYIETDPTPYDGGIANIPDTHIWGAELEASYLGAQDRLHVNGNLSIEKGEIYGTYKTIDSTVQQAIESQPYPSPCAYGGIYYNPGCAKAVIAAEINVAGKNPAQMPAVVGSFNVAYDIPVFRGTLTPRVEFIFRDGFWSRIFNVPSLDRVNSYGLVNINVDYVPTAGHWNMALAATNIGNVAGVNSRYADPYGTFTTSNEYIPPFQIVGRVGYTF